MMSHLSFRVGMGGIRELLDGKIWEWDLSFRWEWEWDGNEVIETGGNWFEKSVPAHLYSQHDPARIAADTNASAVGLLAATRPQLSIYISCPQPIGRIIGRT